MFDGMWTAIEWDDTDVMEHLDENHYVSRALHNLIVVVVGSREHWRPDAVHVDAPHGERLILYGVKGAAHSLSRLGALRCFLPPLG